MGKWAKKCPLGSTVLQKVRPEEQASGDDNLILEANGRDLQNMRKQKTPTAMFLQEGQPGEWAGADQDSLIQDCKSSN